MFGNIVKQENSYFTAGTAVMDYNVSMEPGKMLITTNVPRHDGNGGRGYNTISVNITEENTDEEVLALVCAELKRLHRFEDVSFIRPPYIRRYL